jgi:hypothetical protein
MESFGVFEYYRQIFGSPSPDPEPEQVKQPLPPKPDGDPFDFYFSGNGNDAAPGDVVLRATGLSGRAYLPDARGLFVVTAEDAKPLCANGWQRVEQQQA